MPKMLDLAELASREPWWTTKNGNSVAHVEITLDERDAILRLVKERDALREQLKYYQETDVLARAALLWAVRAARGSHPATFIGKDGATFCNICHKQLTAHREGE